jgi:hypothetical protein
MYGQRVGKCNAATDVEMKQKTASDSEKCGYAERTGTIQALPMLLLPRQPCTGTNMFAPIVWTVFWSPAKRERPS